METFNQTKVYALLFQKINKTVSELPWTHNSVGTHTHNRRNNDIFYEMYIGTIHMHPFKWIELQKSRAD